MLSGDRSKFGLQFLLNKTKKNVLSLKTGQTETEYLFSMTHVNWKQYRLALKSLSEYYLNEYNRQNSNSQIKYLHKVYVQLWKRSMQLGRSSWGSFLSYYSLNCPNNLPRWTLVYSKAIARVTAIVWSGIWRSFKQRKPHTPVWLCQSGGEVQ